MCDFLNGKSSSDPRNDEKYIRKPKAIPVANPKPMVVRAKRTIQKQKQILESIIVAFYCVFCESQTHSHTMYELSTMCTGQRSLSSPMTSVWTIPALHPGAASGKHHSINLVTRTFPPTPGTSALQLQSQVQNMSPIGSFVWTLQGRDRLHRQGQPCQRTTAKPKACVAHTSANM